MIRYKQPALGRNYTPFYEQYAHSTTHLCIMLPSNAAVLGVPFFFWGGGVAWKRRREGQAGDGDGSQSPARANNDNNSLLERGDDGPKVTINVS